MPFFIKREHNRLAFQFGRQAALRSTSDVVDQLQARVKQLEAQLAQEKLNAAEERKLNAAEERKEKAVALRELMQARLELAQRNLVDAFAGAASPSAMVH